MQKIEMIALLKDSKKIIDSLQRKGVVEITQHEAPEAMYSMDTAYTVTQIEKFSAIAQQAKDILNEYSPEKTSLIDSFKPRKEIELSRFLDMADDTDITMSKCYDIIDAAKNISEANADIIRCNTMIASLSVWDGLDIPVSCSGTKYAAVIAGTFPTRQTDESIKEKLAELVPEVEAVETEIVSAEDMLTCAVVICLKKDSEKVTEALRSFGFTRPSEAPKKSAADVIAEYNAKIDADNKTVADKQEYIKSLSDEHNNIDFLIDYFNIRSEKYDAFKKISVTDKVFYISGFIPQKYCEKTIEQLENKYIVAITVSDPGEDEDTPVLLENNAFAAPAEEITEMYSLPGKHDIDPNAIMAFFYYVFFGMMLSDAGYGLLMVIATLFVLLKCKPEGKKKKTILMYLYCGISTMFWGAMFGSFFGDLINTIRTNYMGLPEMRLYVWLNPQGDDLMTTMMWCFLFGLVHLFVGVAIKGYMEWRQGDKFGAVCDTLSIYLAVGGAAPICAGMIIDVPANITAIGKYCALAGVVLIVLTAGRQSKGIFGKLGAGLYALYNTVSGYLSDVLSYSRLLALGLVTGIIGSVVNMMGTLPENMIVKTILFIIVFIFGHAVNFGINIIGAYVHTNRLQYVEFFSRFYEGGGVAFNPLKVNSKTFKFKEETNNG